MGFLRVLTGADAAREASRDVAEGNQAGIDEIRRQFDLSTEQMQPFIQAGLPQLGNLTQGASAGGFADIIKNIMSGDLFGDLVGERQNASNSALGSAGLTRSGGAASEAARIPTDLAFQIEAMLNGRQSALAGNAQNAAAGQGALGTNTASQIAGLLSATGEALGQGRVNAAGANLGGLGTLAGIAGMFFSDPMLKTNIVPLGEIYDLNVYGWDYIDEAPDFVKKGMRVGFMADEAKTLYPQYVHDVSGVMVIDYDGLLTHLSRLERRVH